MWEMWREFLFQDLWFSYRRVLSVHTPTHCCDAHELLFSSERKVTYSLALMLIDCLISLIINIWPPTEIGTLLLYIGERTTVDFKFNLYKDFWVLVLIGFFSFYRWVLCANHTEPVKGFLGRYLRRKLIEMEIERNIRNNDLVKIIDWIPKTWHHLNSFLETHSSSDVTIGELQNCNMPFSRN